MSRTLEPTARMERDSADRPAGASWSSLSIGLLYSSFALLVFTALTWPPGQDQGIYSWVGSVLNDGGLPYRDAWELKGMATHYAYAFGQLLTGQGGWGYRAIDIAFVLVGAVSAWRLVWRLHGRTAAHMATILLVFWYARLGYWDTAQPDGWAAMLLLAAAAICHEPADGRAGFRGGIAAGVALALSLHLKIVFVVYAPLLFVWLCTRRRWDVCFAFAATFAIATMVPFGYMAVRGGWGALWEVQVAFTTSVHAPLHDRSGLQHVIGLARFVRAMPPAILVSALVGTVMLVRRGARDTMFLAAWGLVGVGLVMIQNKYYWYHWIPVYPSLAVAAGIGLAGIWDTAIARLTVGGSASRRFVERAIPSLVAALLLATVFPLSDVTAAVRSRVGGVEAREDYLRRFTLGDNYSYLTDLKAAEFVSDNTPEGATLLVWGFEPLVNVLSDRPSPTRFGVNYPLVVGEGSELFARYRAEFISGLGEHPPALVIVVERDESNQTYAPSNVALETFPEFTAWLNAGYELTGRIDDFQIWSPIGRGGSDE